MAFDLIDGKSRDLRGFSVRRVLPSLAHRAVGPFVFLDAPRTLEWNFVASSREAIAVAREAWQRYPSALFPQVPGETEFIPLPSAPHPPSTPL